MPAIFGNSLPSIPAGRLHQISYLDDIGQHYRYRRVAAQEAPPGSKHGQSELQSGGHGELAASVRPEQVAMAAAREGCRAQGYWH